MRKLLVPVDFSDYTDAVVLYASKLAADLGGKLCIVHIDETHGSSSALGEDSFVYIPRGSSADDVTQPSRLEQVRPTEPGVECEHRDLAGDPVEEIVAMAKHEDVDMIVMGSHGRTGLSRLLMGSVAEGVIRHAACPVLIVKKNARDGAATSPPAVASQTPSQPTSEPN